MLVLAPRASHCVISRFRRLDALHATGDTRRLAERFLTISSPFLPPLAAGMCCSGLLRCVADVKRAMHVTLFAALATAVIDPILIFGLHLGLPGAAISTVLSRFVLATLGWQGRHGSMTCWPVRRSALWLATCLPFSTLPAFAAPIGAKE